MRKIALLLALAASSLFLNTGTASAANCSASTSHTVHNANQIYVQFNIFNCSDVDRVVWQNSVGTQYSGWYDTAGGNFAMSLFKEAKLPLSGGCYCDYEIDFFGNGGGNHAIFAYQTCWYIGQTRNLVPGFWWKIHGATSHAWGSLHFTQTYTDAVTC